MTVDLDRLRSLEAIREGDYKVVYLPQPTDYDEIDDPQILSTEIIEFVPNQLKIQLKFNAPLMVSQQIIMDDLHVSFRKSKFLMPARYSQKQRLELITKNRYKQVFNSDYSSIPRQVKEEDAVVLDSVG